MAKDFAAPRWWIWHRNCKIADPNPGMITSFGLSDAALMDAQMVALPATMESRSTKYDQHRRIQEAVQVALSKSGYRAIAGLQCVVIEDVIRLSGIVYSYYQKQIAQEVVLRLKEVQRIDNAVQVRRF